MIVLLLGLRVSSVNFTAVFSVSLPTHRVDRWISGWYEVLSFSQVEGMSS